MNVDNEADTWPSGIVIEGVDVSNNVMIKNPLLIGNSFEGQNPFLEPPSNNVMFEDPMICVAINEQNTNMCKPFVGMEFDTIEASHVFWDRYARDTGFRARVRSSKRKRDGVIQTRTYVCAKEGISSEDKRHINPKRRCGCGVIMIVCLVKGKGAYRVTTLVEEHNHELDGVEGHQNNSASVQGMCKPIAGMEFDTVEASEAFWEQYARDVGFRGRIRSTKRDKNGVVRSRKYVCSREGKKCDDPRYFNSEHRLDTRCGCGVLMTIAIVKGKGTYRVVTFSEEHNHGFDVQLSIPRRKVPGQRVGVSQRRKSVVVESPLPNLTNSQEFGINNGLDGEQNISLEAPLFNLTNAQRMGILCTEFMQLAYRAVGSNDVFEGVRRLIKDGHLLADKN